MDEDDMRTLDMQMQRPGPMGVKNVMVTHEVGEKVADGDLLLVPTDSGYYVDPEDADDAVQSIKPQTTVKYKPPHACSLFGIVYAAQQQAFSIEETAKTAVNTPACTVFGTNAVVNRSGDVIRAFEKLTFGPVKHTPAPAWRQPTDATVTIRRVSALVWRVSHTDLLWISRTPDLYALFQREVRETCAYTMVPALLLETYHLDATTPNWTPADLQNAIAPYVAAPDTADVNASLEEIKYIDAEMGKIIHAPGATPAAVRENIRAFLADLYYDHMRNQEMISLSRCPVDHHCETLLRF